MTLLQTFFRGNRPPAGSGATTPSTSSSPATPSSTPARLAKTPSTRRKAKIDDSPIRPESGTLPSVKAFDYATVSPRNRPLPPTPNISPVKASPLKTPPSSRRPNPNMRKDPVTPVRQHVRTVSSPAAALVALPPSTARPRASTVQSNTTTPVKPQYPSPAPRTPPSLKKRPIALKLQTSNLGAAKTPRQRSSTRATAEPLSDVHEESAVSENSPSPLDPTQHDQCKSLISTAVPPTATATATSTPDQDTSPFQNVPLPWSTVPITDLRSALGPLKVDSLVEYTIDNLATGASRLLHPSILSTAASEDVRLREELDRLKGKHRTTIRQRDRALSELESLAIKGEMRSILRTLKTLKKLSHRCDRIAKQMFICNDQIRQIEIQGEEHIIGALRCVLDKKNHALVEHDSMAATIPLPSLEVTLEATPTTSIFETPWSTTLPDESHLEPKSTSATRSIHLENLLDSVRSPAETSSRPMSTMTVMSLGMGGLGFPLPPSRTPGLEDRNQGIDNSGISNSLQVPKTALEASLHSPRIHVRPLSIHKAASTNDIVTLSRLSRGSVDSQEITIYPPGHHRRSESAPLLGALDLPHTPWLLDAPVMEDSPISAAKTSYLLAPISLKSSVHSGPTKPLRLKRSPDKLNGGIRPKSFGFESRPPSEETKRHRRGRDTQLEAPESILLSLATAEFWTKGIDAAAAISPTPSSMLT